MGGTQVEESDGQAESESGVPVDYSFSNFSFKVLLSMTSLLRTSFVRVYKVYLVAVVLYPYFSFLVLSSMLVPLYLTL